MIKKSIALVCVMACLLTLSISAFAAETRASEQIKQYSMSVTPQDGDLIIEFSVAGNGKMNKIGCQSIYIYEKSGTTWSYVESLSENNSGMSKTNTHFHANAIYCDFEAGVDYKVVVTVFAEDSAGRDTRTKTFYV